MAAILAPDKSQMLDHLGLLFGRAMRGRIEITAIKVTAEGEPHGVRTHYFNVDQLEEAADRAFEINSEHMWNVYVGAALRAEDVFPGRAASDKDFYRAWAIHADIDDDHDLAAVRAEYRRLNIVPPYIVVTGRTPTTRAQLWWPLEEPIGDADSYRDTLRGVVGVLKTDPHVTAAKQLMRLAGGINWPKKDGRVLEKTEIVRPSNAAASFSLEQIHRAFPPAAALATGEMGEVEVVAAGALGLTERVMDGRETYAFRLVRAHLREWIGTTGSEPAADELYRDVAPVYLAKADQVRPGRGPEFLKAKCAEAMRAYRAGQIPGLRSLEEGVQTWAERKREGRVEEPDEEFPAEAEGDAPVSEPFRASELTGDPPERRWIVREWIVEGAVNSLYGDGGLGKTLLAQQLACAVSLGVPWLGMETSPGPVLAILCEDDKEELWRRHQQIKAAMGYTIGNPFSDVWLWPRVGDDNVLIRWDRDGKPTLGPFAGLVEAAVRRYRPALLILDTLADFYGGNEIDRPQVNYFVKTVLGGLIKDRAAAGDPLTVLLLGHPSVAGKASGAGYSGSTAWNNAVRSRMYLTRPEEGASDERILTRGKANYAKSGDETALRLFYAEGVLHASDDIEDGDSILWAARREVVDKVDAAWRRGEPYSAQKSHRRFIFGALSAELTGGGFTPNIVRQAIRECLEDGKVRVGNSNGKRGYRGRDGAP